VYVTSNFRCDTGKWSCVSNDNSGAVKTYTVTDLDTLGNTVIREVMQTDGLNAHSIKVTFRSSDILNQVALMTRSLYSITGASQTATSSLPMATSSTASVRESPANSSKGAWVGVGIGATLGTMLLLLGVFYVVRIRPRKDQQPEIDVQEQPPPPPPKPGRTPVTQVHTTTRVGEMYGDCGLYELDTDKTARQDWPGIKADDAKEDMRKYAESWDSWAISEKTPN
jgi:hypothetical protein